MTNQELMLECMKLALTIVSPTVDNRQLGIVNVASALYTQVQSVGESKTVACQCDQQKQTRRGRKPKPCAE